MLVLLTCLKDGSSATGPAQRVLSRFVWALLAISFSDVFCMGLCARAVLSAVQLFTDDTADRAPARGARPAHPARAAPESPDPPVHVHMSRVHVPQRHDTRHTRPECPAATRNSPPLLLWALEQPGPYLKPLSKSRKSWLRLHSTGPYSLHTNFARFARGQNRVVTCSSTRTHE